MEGSQSQAIGPYDITFSLKPGASAEDAVYLHEQVKAHPYVIDSEMTVADFAGECDRLRAENERLKASVALWERRFDAWENWRLFEALGGSQAKGSE